MAEIKSLRSLAKTSATSKDVLLVTNTSTNAAKQYSLSNLFPSGSTLGSSSESIFVNITNKNQMNFKGLKSANTKLLALSTSDNNIMFRVKPSGIDLSQCDNSRSAFGSGTNLNKSVTGVLSPIYGGTGLSRVVKGSILVAHTDTSWSALALNTDGQLLIGNTVAGRPTTGKIVGGANVSITNSPGIITISSNLARLTGNFDTGSYNIDLDSNYLSPTGADKGIYFKGNSVIINDSDQTANSTATTTADGQLHLMGTNVNAITIGNGANASNYQTEYNINCDTSTSGVGGGLNIKPGTGHTDYAGGALKLYGGAGTGTGNGGALELYSGDTASGGSGGVGGQIRLIAQDEGADVTAFIMTNAGAISMSQNVTVAKTLRVSEANTSQFVTAQGDQAVTDDGTAVLSAANILQRIVTCTPSADRSKVTDTAANYVAGNLGLDNDNDSIDFSFINLATNGTSHVTLTGGTGITLVGCMVISAQDLAEDAFTSGTAQFRVRRVSATAVTIYRIA